MEKRCEVCGSMKPIKDFSKSYKKRCKQCVAEIVKAERAAPKNKQPIEGLILESLDVSISRRDYFACRAMAELMKWEYYREDRLPGHHPDQPSSGLLTNKNKLCNCAVSYADKMIELLDKNDENKDQVV